MNYTGELWRSGVKRILWWLIAGSKGGINRARIIQALHKRPYNANQLTQLFGLDYKTIRHHLDILKKHQVIISMGEGYGTMYFLSDQMKSKYDEFLEIWNQVEVPDQREEG
jgi:DNA-binding transcriptional ArsR family regulator